MKTLLFLAASTLAICVAACAPNAKPALRTALDCPASQGDLTRTDKAADGKTCTYRSSGGGEVTLELVAVTGDVTKTLRAIETTIAPEANRFAVESRAVADEAKDAADAASDTAEAAKSTAEDAKAAARDAAAVAREAAADAGRSAGATASIGGKDDWNTDAKGKSGDTGVKIASGDGDSARIDLPGIHISARDDDTEDGGGADVRIGGMRVNANASADESTIRIFRDVRLRGEALSREKRGVRATFISTNNADAGGYRYVGYEAAGPKTGPLTVAIVKAKSEMSHDDGMVRDVRRLVRRNGGA